MNNKAVLYEQRGNVAIITLNRPAAYNTITQALIDGITDGLVKAEKDDSVHAMVITGSGSKAFCAGIDLKEIAKSDKLMNGDESMLEAMKNRKKPLIGAINGYAMTGGMELAMMSDLLYASENAVFADTHCKVGLIPGWGMSQRLPRLIGYGRAKEMSLSGRKVDAQTALAWGLVNRVFPLENLLDEAIKLAAEVAAHPPKMVQDILTMIDKGANMSIDDALAYENKKSVAHNSQLDYSGMQRKLEQMQSK